MALPPTPVARFALTVCEHIFSYGMSWEEPEEVEGYAYYVVAQGLNGERYAHFKTFRLAHSCAQKGCNERAPHDDSPWKCEDAAKNEFASEGDAKAAAQALLARIAAAQKAGTWAGPVESEHWREIQPEYGSIAYEEGGWEAHNAEREREEDALR
jgi:hypothetical protein